jgi:methylated-DNA-[protein]-cysteine S-methyltransferase
MNPTRARTIDSPVGVLTLAGDEALTRLWMHDQNHAPLDSGSWTTDATAFPDVVEQLGAYFAGDLVAFDVTIRLEGTAFQRRVWDALRAIPYGETVSYGHVAAVVGQPAASRAVGVANGRNPIAIIVPCHRVIGANGSLTGYGGGLSRKQWLLDLERARREPRLDVFGGPKANSGRPATD